MREMFSPMAQWYCSQRCHNQRERDCYTDAVSRVVCQCRVPTVTRGVKQTQEAQEDNLTLVIPERLAPLHHERTQTPNPLVVNVIERNVKRHVDY